MEAIIKRLKQNLHNIRQERPLIHNITNFVVMNITANALLALGASPVMAHAAEEVEDMVGIARCLILNIGTLSPQWVESMKKAMQTAAVLKKPIVLDPVGAGATPYRTDVVKALLQTAPVSVIRGNASEIQALVDAGVKTRGVDSLAEVDTAIEAARKLSHARDCTVVVSGARDRIVKGDQMLTVHNGHSLMTRVTGMGCTATALIGAFCAVETDPLHAAAGAMTLMGMAGELAAEKADGPGSFQMHFLDALYGLDDAGIAQRIRLSCGGFPSAFNHKP
jgi:hydroxyethylthiazole kinase